VTGMGPVAPALRQQAAVSPCRRSNCALSAPSRPSARRGGSSRPPTLVERERGAGVKGSYPRYYGWPTRRPKTNFSVGCVGSVVVPSWALPASLLTAGIAKYWKVMVVSPGRAPGSTSKMEYP